MTAAEAAAVARTERELAARAAANNEKKNSTTPNITASAGTSGQAVVAAPIARIAEANTGPDDFTLIDGVSAGDADALRSAGVRTYGEIANWSAADVRRVAELIGDKRRIARQNWIEQAQLLHAGTATAFARKAGAEVTPRPAPPAPVVQSQPIVEAEPETQAAIEPSPAPSPDVESVAESSKTAALAAAAAAAAAAFGVSSHGAGVVEGVSDTATRGTGAAASMREDLQQIDGINAEVVKLLNEQGVTRISQIANWSVNEEHRIDRLLGGMNRVHREAWVRQARKLSGYSDEEDPADAAATAPDVAPATEMAPPEATPSEIIPAETLVPEPAQSEPAPSVGEPTGDEPVNVAPPTNVVPLNREPTPPVRGLRSVRSEALTRPSSAADKPDAGHDLKRIRGIGVLIEKRLRAMGYTSYEQIGAWTAADIDKVGQRLDIPGRIQRENWVEQARILFNGGQTEFSRRMDRRDT